MVNENDLTEFKLKDGDFELTIRSNLFSKEPRPSMMTASPAMMPSPVQHVQADNSGAAAQTAQPSSSPANGQADEAESNLLEIRSPIVGTFYRSSSPDKPPFVKVGDNVDVGSVVCIVEAMKLFNEIESEIGGKIVKVMVEDASPVQYDQVLYLVEPA